MTHPLLLTLRVSLTLKCGICEIFHFSPNAINLTVVVSSPGEVLVSVVSISATSISLSWSVSSGGRVDSWEVAVRQPDNRGTTKSSGPLSLTTYTISQLEPTTLYTLTVSATNVAGTTNSTPIIVSTGKSIVCAKCK